METKYLIVKQSVQLTEIMIPVIKVIDQLFEREKHIAYVTSGKRDPDGQLNIIKNYAHLNNIDKEFPEILSIHLHDKIRFGGLDVYSWQPAWSRLLEMGVIISPPISAVALFPYYHPKNPTVNKQNTLIRSSEHVCEGDIHPFDIGGATNGIRDELNIIEKSKLKIPGMVDYLVERNNNCIHVRCRKVVA